MNASVIRFSYAARSGDGLLSEVRIKRLRRPIGRASISKDEESILQTVLDSRDWLRIPHANIRLANA